MTISWKLQVFFDAECPLCRREIAWLQRRNKAGAVDFVDISALDFDGDAYGKSYPELMSRIHARLPSGEWLEGPEVLRLMYEHVGFRWFAAFTRWPGVRQLFDYSYSIFARNRWRLTGRRPLSCEACGCESSPPSDQAA